MSVTDTAAAVEPPRPTAGVDWAKDDHAVAVVAPTDSRRCGSRSATMQPACAAWSAAC